MKECLSAMAQENKCSDICTKHYGAIVSKKRKPRPLVRVAEIRKLCIEDLWFARVLHILKRSILGKKTSLEAGTWQQKQGGRTLYSGSR